MHEKDARHKAMTGLAWLTPAWGDDPPGTSYCQPGGMMVLCVPGSDGCPMTSDLSCYPSCSSGTRNWSPRRRRSPPRCSSWKTIRSSPARSRPGCGRCAPAGRCRSTRDGEGSTELARRLGTVPRPGFPTRDGCHKYPARTRRSRPDLVARVAFDNWYLPRRSRSDQVVRSEASGDGGVTVRCTDCSHAETSITGRGVHSPGGGGAGQVDHHDDRQSRYRRGNHPTGRPLHRHWERSCRRY